MRNPLSYGTSGGVLLATFLLLSLAGEDSQARSRLAPADEYFGRARMSPIEISNRIRDAERHGASYHALLLTQGALEEWLHKYPGDTWIPEREYRLAHLFAKLHSRDGNAEAQWCRAVLEVHFIGNHYALAAQREFRSAKARKRHRFLGL